MPEDMTAPKTEDFYARLLNIIDVGDYNYAVEMVIEIGDKRQQVDILANLAGDLARDSALALDSVRDPARALDSVRDRAHVLARAFDRALAHALARDLAHDLASDLARARARDHARDLDLALAHARDLDLALTHARDLEFVHRRARLILAVLSRMFGEDAGGVSPTGIHLTGIDVLTPGALATQVVPYLQAVSDVQQIISRLKGEPFTEPRITGISQQSLTGIALDGAAEAFDIMRNIIVPWRHDHAKHLAELEAHLEFEQKKIALRDTAFDLALTIVDRCAPNMPEEERLNCIPQLLNPLTVLIESPLEIDTDDSTPATRR